MRWLVAFIVVILAATALSGCLGTDTAPASEPSGSDEPTPVPTVDNSSAPEAPNQAPVANLTASTVNGTSPLNVTFTINATDPDQDNLTWTLDADGDAVADANGTGVPSPPTVNFTYGAPGDFNVTLNVTDGKLSATSALVINVTAGVAAPPPPPIVIKGKAYVPDVLYVVEGECLFPLLQMFFGLPVGDINGNYHKLPHPADGWAYKVEPTGLNAKWIKGTGYVGDDAEKGNVPAGADGVMVCSTSAVNASYTLTITPV